MIRLLLALLLPRSKALAGGYEGTPTPGAGSPSPIGPQGDPGCSVLPTHGPPSVSYGLVCDWAFDAGAGAVYGPKTTGGWGAPLVMTPVQQAQTQGGAGVGLGQRRGDQRDQRGVVGKRGLGQRVGRIDQRDGGGRERTTPRHRRPTRRPRPARRRAAPAAPRRPPRGC